MAEMTADLDALFWILDSGEAPGKRNGTVLRDPLGPRGSLQTVRGLGRGGSRALAGAQDPRALEGQSPWGLPPFALPFWAG